jgi:hypothetical protein
VRSAAPATMAPATCMLHATVTVAASAAISRKTGARGGRDAASQRCEWPWMNVYIDNAQITKGNNNFL